jgi:transcriptional regulator with XRE-family HTH domain
MRDWVNTSLGERVRWLAKRDGISLTKLGKRAGLLSGAMSRLANDTGPVARSPATLAALADAAGVPLEWLALGRGQPTRASTSVVAGPYPHRAEAARIAIDGGISEEAVQAVLDEDPRLSEDPSVLWWLHQIEGRALLRELSPAPQSGLRFSSTQKK